MCERSREAERYREENESERGGRGEGREERESETEVRHNNMKEKTIIEVVIREGSPLIVDWIC